MDSIVKTKYLNLVNEIDKSIKKLKKERNLVDNQKKDIDNRLKILETQKKELKSHIN